MKRISGAWPMADSLANLGAQEDRKFFNSVTGCQKGYGIQAKHNGIF
jgi:hypothetical protein